MGEPHQLRDPLLTSRSPNDHFIPDFSGDSEYEEDSNLQIEQRSVKRGKTRQKEEEHQIQQSETESLFSESEVERMLANACPDRSDWIKKAATHYRSMPDFQSSDSESSTDSETEEFFEVEHTGDGTSEEKIDFEDAQDLEFPPEDDSGIEIMNYNDKVSSGTEDFVVTGSTYKVDPKTGIVKCESKNWTAYRPEPRRLTYVPFQVRNDEEPSLVLIYGPLTFSKTWCYNHWLCMATIKVTNTSDHAVCYMAYPSDLKKLTIEQSHGLIEFGKSASIIVHSSLKVPYSFRDLIDERIVFLVAPVKISTKTGLTEEGWETLGMKHYLDFWASYGTAWFPKAEFHELSDFVPENKTYYSEPGINERRWGYGLHVFQILFQKVAQVVGSIFADVEDEMYFLALKGCVIVYPDGTNKKELVKSEKPYKRSTFEKHVLAIETNDYFRRSRSIGKIVKGIFCIVFLAFIIAVWTKHSKDPWFFLKPFMEFFGLSEAFGLDTRSQYSLWKPWTWFEF